MRTSTSGWPNLVADVAVAIGVVLGVALGISLGIALGISLGVSLAAGGIGLSLNDEVDFEAQKLELNS